VNPDALVSGYLQLLKKLPLFGAQNFEVTSVEDDEWKLSPSLVLAINKTGATLLNPATGLVEHQLELKQLLGWRCTPVTVFFMVRFKQKQQGKSVGTLQLGIRHRRAGVEVCCVLQDYCHRMIHPDADG